MPSRKPDTRKPEVLPVIANTSEAARYLRCSEPMVRELIRTNKLHGIRIGRAIRIPRESVEAFLAAEK